MKPPRIGRNGSYFDFAPLRPPERRAIGAVGGKLDVGERGTAEKYASKKRKLVAVTDECEHMRLD